ncbi:TonB-dependent receptor [Enterovirga sp. CN4-39]|uniref:TonB-dependent receptor n=1 Tax=Enterovirga sp. CN4-39 TaxID=3400910 RepID=UPI003C030047
MWFALSAGVASLSAAEAIAQSATALPEIEVIATTPVASSGSTRGIARDMIPGTVETVTAREFERQRSFNLLNTLQARTPGVSLNDVQGSEQFQDLRYRGFAASPLPGTPQGIAVYQNGVRINEAFGDSVNWDFIPPVAINRLDLFSSNPIFGLNALGGAVNIEMKNGFTWQGFETQIQGGSFGRFGGSMQYGAAIGDWGLYIAGDGMRNDGWRFQSPSEIKRFYGDLGYRAESSEFHLIGAGAWNSFGVIGPTPVDLLRLNERSIYTWPQTTRHEMSLVALNGRVDVSPTWTIQGTAYVRTFDQRHVDGNDAEFERCSNQSSFGGRLCLEDDGFGVPPGGRTRAFRDQFAVVGPNGASLPFTPGATYGTVDRTRTSATSYGGSLQATSTETLLGHKNTFILGGSIDGADYSFRSGSELGVIYPNLFVGPSAAVPGTGTGPIRSFGNIGYAPVDLRGTNTYFGLFATDTFEVTDRLAATFAVRLNSIQIDTRDASGVAPELNAKNSFTRANPAFGLTYKLTPEVSVYGGYAEANRAPTPLELNCADRNRPCLLENALVADPPLQQVVSRTFEAGLRSTVTDFHGGTLRFKAGAFRTAVEDDIIALASVIQGRGFYANVPSTLRQGAELSAEYAGEQWQLYANYSFIDATFRFTGAIASPNNPAADDDGNILVRPGHHIPLIPRHQVKAGLEYAFTPAWRFGIELAAFSSQRFAGDEANLARVLPAYWFANLRTTYQVTPNIQVFGVVNNLFDRRYASYGTFFERSAIPNAAGVVFNDPRTITLAQPLSVYGGVKITW